MVESGWNKMDKGMIRELKSDFCKLNYSMRIMEKQEFRGGNMEIKGVAIVAGTSRNGITYEADELRKAAKILEGKPLLVDHNATIDSIVGKVSKVMFNDMNESVEFVAEIMDDKIKEMIKDGRIDSVSIGAIVGNMKKGDGEDMIARDIEFIELSLVSIPGIVGAGITSFDEALSKALVVNEKLGVGMSELEKLKKSVEDAKNAVLLQKMGNDKEIKLELRFD